jgi:hypothetical protein
MKPTISVPEPIARVADLMFNYRADWCLCGGWAVDAWVGRETRDHGDVDLAVFQDDLPVLFEHLAAWQLIAHDPLGPQQRAWDGRARPACAPTPARPAAVTAGILPDRLVDIQVNERRRRVGPNKAPRITMPLQKYPTVELDAPTAVPDVLLSAGHGVRGDTAEPPR